MPSVKRRRHAEPPADEGYDPEAASASVSTPAEAQGGVDDAPSGAYSPTAPAASAAAFVPDFRIGHETPLAAAGPLASSAPEGPVANDSHGPQQAHGNAVLSPEVAAVLNGLFDRRFFKDADIDARAIDFLAGVAPPLALDALADIQRRDFSAVRNMPAFIFSIFKSVVAGGGSGGGVAAVVPSYGGPAVVPDTALAHLPNDVAKALQAVFGSGVCHPSQFDDRAMDILVELHPVDAVRALSEFAAMEPGRVRNPSAFWMGLARKYKNQSLNGGGGGQAPMQTQGRMGMGPPSMGPPSMGPPMGGGGGLSMGAAQMGAHAPAGMPYGAPQIMGQSGSYGGGGAGGGGGGGGGFSALDQRLDELSSMGVLRPDMLDDRAADALRKLPERDALSVLAELPEPSRVRNMSAYVMGLCKKFATGEARSLTGQGRGGGGGGGGGGGVGNGYGGGAGGNVRDVQDALSRMDQDVRDRFYAMVDRGMFPESAFDHRAITALQGLNVNEACAALDELANSDPRRIHNISAYWMGLAKKFGAKAL